MLIDDKTDADVVTLRPTTDGNGFVAGQEYAFFRDYGTQASNGFYTNLPKSGHLRYVSHLNQPSAHLWDGKNWYAAGHFEYVRDGE